MGNQFNNCCKGRENPQNKNTPSEDIDLYSQFQHNSNQLKKIFNSNKMHESAYQSNHQTGVKHKGIDNEYAVGHNDITVKNSFPDNGILSPNSPSKFKNDFNFNGNGIQIGSTFDPTNSHINNPFNKIGKNQTNYSQEDEGDDSDDIINSIQEIQSIHQQNAGEEDFLSIDNQELYMSEKLIQAKREAYKTSNHMNYNGTQPQLVKLFQARNMKDYLFIIKALNDDTELFDELKLGHPWVMPPHTIGSAATIILCSFLNFQQYKDNHPQLSEQQQFQEFQQQSSIIVNTMIKENGVAKIQHNLKNCTMADRHQLTMLLAQVLLDIPPLKQQIIQIGLHNQVFQFLGVAYQPVVRNMKILCLQFLYQLCQYEQDKLAMQMAGLYQIKYYQGILNEQDLQLSLEIFNLIQLITQNYQDKIVVSELVKNGFMSIIENVVAETQKIQGLQTLNNYAVQCRNGLSSGQDQNQQHLKNPPFKNSPSKKYGFNSNIDDNDLPLNQHQYQPVGQNQFKNNNQNPQIFNAMQNQQKAQTPNKQQQIPSFNDPNNYQKPSSNQNTGYSGQNNFTQGTNNNVNNMPQKQNNFNLSNQQQQINPQNSKFPMQKPQQNQPAQSQQFQQQQQQNKQINGQGNIMLSPNQNKNANQNSLTANQQNQTQKPVQSLQKQLQTNANQVKQLPNQQLQQKNQQNLNTQNNQTQPQQLSYQQQNNNNNSNNNKILNQNSIKQNQPTMISGYTNASIQNSQNKQQNQYKGNPNQS